MSSNNESSDDEIINGIDAKEGSCNKETFRI